MSNHSPQLRLRWDAERLGITGREAAHALDRGTPRIIVAEAAGERPNQMASSVTIMPYMMNPGEHTVVAKALHQVLAHPPKVNASPQPSGAPAGVSGRWDVEIRFLTGTANHQFTLEQHGGLLSGRHRMEFLENPLSGEVHGSDIRFHSAHRYEGTVLEYEFRGQMAGDGISGQVHMGEYGTAAWSAHRV